MLLQIILEKSIVKIIIKDGDETVAESGWDGDLSLSEKLLPEIDRFLNDNGLTKDKVKKAVAVYDEESSVTSARIVQTVADAWNCAR